MVWENWRQKSRERWLKIIYVTLVVVVNLFPVFKEPAVLLPRTCDVLFPVNRSEQHRNRIVAQSHSLRNGNGFSNNIATLHTTCDSAAEWSVQRRLAKWAVVACSRAWSLCRTLWGAWSLCRLSLSLSLSLWSPVIPQNQFPVVVVSESLSLSLWPSLSGFRNDVICNMLIKVVLDWLCCDLQLYS